jgi:diguanylate cyclase (GGDEF)-like protein/PAS domain S-box-containing protein
VTLGVAIALFGVVFALRLSVDDPFEPILFLLVIPVALVAAETGLGGGLLAAAAASCLVVAWDVIADPPLTPIGFGARFVVYLVTGAFVGFLTWSRRELEAESTRWFDNSLDLNCVADFDGNLLRINRAFEETLGYTGRELLSTPYVAHVHPEDRKGTNDASATLAGGHTRLADFENRYRAKDGSYRWFRWTASSDQERKLIYASARDVTKVKELEAELLERAQTDPLTGLFNRRHFEEEARRQVDFLRRYGHGGALFVIDVDSFKRINDDLGHAAGDDALRRVGDAITARIRQSDTAGRIGGDEFAILFPGMGRADAESLAGTLLGSLGETSSSSRLSCSVGIAIVDPADDASLADLLAAADGAMYAAKRAGGDGWHVSEPADDGLPKT